MYLTCRVEKRETRVNECDCDEIRIVRHEVMEGVGSKGKPEVSNIGLV